MKKKILSLSLALCAGACLTLGLCSCEDKAEFVFEPEAEQDYQSSVAQNKSDKTENASSAPESGETDGETEKEEQPSQNPGENIEETDENGVHYLLEGDTYTVVGARDVNVGHMNLVIPATFNGKSVTKIKEKAFDTKGHLKSISLPESITLIEEGAFYSCGAIDYITVDEGNQVYKSDGNCLIERSTNKLLLGSNQAVIPEYVTEIAPNAFRLVSFREEITIPASVKVIGEHAFVLCIELKSVTLSEGLEKIGVGAFNATHLESIVIPDSVTEMDESAFAYNEYLESVTLGNGLTKIEESAFIGCRALESVEIPKGIEKIQKSAFEKCNNLKSVCFEDASGWYCGGEEVEEETLLNEEEAAEFLKSGKVLSREREEETETQDPQEDEKTIVGTKGLKYVLEEDGYSVYWEGKSVTLVVIPETYEGKPVTEIRENGFFKANINYITIPGSVKRIGKSAFETSQLKEVFLPQSVEEIESLAFFGCYLEKITVAEGNKFYEGRGNCLIEKSTKTLLYGCDDSVIPEGVKIIGNYAFHFHRRALESIVIPDSVTEIQRDAFSNCTKLKSVKLSKNLVKIGDFAFSGCMQIESITLPASLQEIGDGAFRDCGLKSIIFEETSGWKDAEGAVDESILSDAEHAAEFMNSCEGLKRS